MKKSYYCIFWICLFMMFGVLAWLSYSLVQAEQRRERELVQNFTEQQTRLALWRMDSELSRLIAEESKKAPDFFLEENQHDKPDYVLEYFESRSVDFVDNRTSEAEFEKNKRREESIQAFPRDQIDGIGAMSDAGAVELARTRQELQKEAYLKTDLYSGQVAELADKASEKKAEQITHDYLARTNMVQANTQAQSPRVQSRAGKKFKEIIEEVDVSVFKDLSNKEIEDSVSLAAIVPAAEAVLKEDISEVAEQDLTLKGQEKENRGGRQAGLGKNYEELRDLPISISPFVAKWLGEELFFTRTVGMSDYKVEQGFKADWNRLASLLLHSARDILPEARLEPFTKETVTQENVSRLLAGVPLILEPGVPSQLPELSGAGGYMLPLVMSWLFAVMAVVGVVVLLSALWRLNERRATFVSAVTHELRTPLTTFNLYTEMLINGMVPHEKTGGYFKTLRQEAIRLTHLVDNVLGFSRIEKNTVKTEVSLVEARELLEHMERSIKQVLERGAMKLNVKAEPDLLSVNVLTNIGAVEQILVNLSDNVVKYACAEEGEVTLTAEIQGRFLMLLFCDDGKGISRDMQKRLFKPFSRSAEDAAGDKPGIGLGLALSRQMARKVGGDLVLKHTGETGTCFMLKIPLER